MPQTIKLALLDDYQKVAMRMADSDRLKKRGVEITVFHEPFKSIDDAAQKLAPFEILGLLRERTAFPRALIEKLPNLKLMVLTGARAAGRRARPGPPGPRRRRPPPPPPPPPPRGGAPRPPPPRGARLGVADDV